MSKVQSHEKKEVLYADLVQANLVRAIPEILNYNVLGSFESVEGNLHLSSFQEEQQRLRGTIEEADEMIKSLDDCICELEAGMATVRKRLTAVQFTMPLSQYECK